MKNQGGRAMKKHLQRSLVFLFAIVMLCSLLTGCETGNIQPKTSAPASGTSNSSSAGDNDELVTLTSMSATASINLSYSDTKNSKTWPHLIDLLADKGIKLDMEVIDVDQYDATLHSRIASGTNLPDLLFCSELDANTRINMINQGTVVALDKIMEYGDKSGTPGTAKAELTKGGYYDFIRSLNTYVDGKMYFWTGAAVNSGMNIGPSGLFDAFAAQIRVDWLEKLKLNMPKTIDDVINVVKAFRDNDVNSDGLKDERIVIPTDTFCNGIAQWFGLGPFAYSVDLSKQKLVTPFDQPGFTEYIKYMQKLTKEGLLDVTDNSKILELAAADKVAIDFNTAAHPQYAKLSSDENAYLNFIPSINALEGVTPAMSYQVSKLVFPGYWCFTNSVDNDSKIKAAAKLFDFFFSEDYWEFMLYGVEGSTFEYDENGVRQETARFNHTLEELREIGLATGFWYGGGGSHGGVLPRMAAGPEWNAGTSGTAEGLFNSLDEMLASDFYKNRFAVYKRIGAKGHWEDNIRQNMTPESDYYCYMDNISGYCAMATQEELNIIAEYSSDLDIRMAEILEKLIIGQYSIDDWDKYRKELSELGFDKIFDVYSAQCDRYFATMK
jgi:ABC-type glycerol-3-phosphate transport system substrate-binding protein